MQCIKHIKIQKIFSGIVIFGMICLLVVQPGLTETQDRAMTAVDSDEMKHVILLGASVGRAWNIERLPERIGNYTYRFEYEGNYSPDKSALLEEILARSDNLPDAVILKECAAFFPGSSDRIKRLMKQWVSKCRERGVIPILATVVPVVKSYPLRMFIYSLLHGRWLYPKETYDSIIAFNDWIVEYGESEGLAVLDLEAAVRTSPTDRHLNDELATRDGLHLKAEAYRKLDEIVIPLLSTLDFDERDIE